MDSEYSDMPYTTWSKEDKWDEALYSTGKVACITVEKHNFKTDEALHPSGRSRVLQ